MFQILRIGILLSVLVVLPVTAVCWNMIPKDIFQTFEKVDDDKSNDNPVDVDVDDHNSTENGDVNPTEKGNTKKTVVEETQDNRSESAAPKVGSDNGVSKIDSDHDIVWMSSSIPLNNDPILNYRAKEIQTDNESKTPAKQNSFPNLTDPKTQPKNEPELVTFMPMSPLQPKNTDKVASQNNIPKNHNTDNNSSNNTDNNKHRQRDFAEMEKELKQLGATYYRLEKWGNHGELFRFCCSVNPTEIPNNNNNQKYNYQKYFQHIDNDEIRVMEHVITEIKKWKESTKPL
ncbi:MAG: hypothetical protein LBQ66_01615 [Planctomycetaceae bacterium]|jgi:hypothetical protein|nr:hypothetical protein [Planctomycetaceae bacterium]